MNTAVERIYSLRQAAATLGVSREHLTRLLREQMQLVLPAVPRGSKCAIPDSLLQSLLERIGPQRKTA